METPCIICNLPMISEDDEPEPTITLMCSHTAHTLCFMRQYSAFHLSDLRCRECNTPVVPNEVLQEAENFVTTTNDNNIVKFMWETEPEFKKGLKSLRTLETPISKSSTALKSKHKALLAEHKEDIDVHVQIIKYKVKQVQNKYTSLEEYKTMGKLVSKYNTAYKHFLKRWGMDSWTIRSGLRNIDGAKPLVPGTPKYFMYRHKYGQYKFGVRIR